MKIEKLRIGKTYYLPQRGCPTSYTSGVLVEIVSKNKVILENKKGNRFSCNTNKLHKSPDKAVRGRKAQERVRHEMNVKKQKDRENLVDKGVQDKIKKLGHSTFATIEQNKYMVVGYKGVPQPRFDTLEELDKWADDELIKLIATLGSAIIAEHKFSKRPILYKAFHSASPKITSNYPEVLSDYYVNTGVRALAYVDFILDDKFIHTFISDMIHHT